MRDACGLGTLPGYKIHSSERITNKLIRYLNQGPLPTGCGSAIDPPTADMMPDDLICAEDNDAPRLRTRKKNVPSGVLPAIGSRIEILAPGTGVYFGALVELCPASLPLTGARWCTITATPRISILVMMAEAPPTRGPGECRSTKPN
jgi:hypothetical protein